jgi:tetratricopeptide (TPR) repeat protein
MLESWRVVPNGMTLDAVILRETLQKELGRVRAVQNNSGSSMLVRSETGILASRFEAMFSLAEANFGTMNNNLDQIGGQLGDIGNAISCLVAVGKDIVSVLESIQSEMRGIYQLLRESQANESRQSVEHSYRALRVNRLPDAEILARRAIDECRISAAAWFSLALVLIERKRRKDSVEALEAARDYAKSAGELANVCTVLSRVYLDFGRVEEAYIEADRASKADPMHVGAWLAVCDAQAARNDQKGLRAGIRGLATADSLALGALFVNQRLKGHAAVVESQVATIRTEQKEANPRIVSAGNRVDIKEFICYHGKYFIHGSRRTVWCGERMYRMSELQCACVNSDGELEGFGAMSSLATGKIRVEQVWFKDEWTLERDALPELAERGLKPLPIREFLMYFVEYPEALKERRKGYVCPTPASGKLLSEYYGTGCVDPHFGSEKVTQEWPPHYRILGFRE